MNLLLLQTAIESHLEKIEKLLGPNYKLTLIANHNGAHDLKDADLVLTMSDRASILRALNRFLPEHQPLANREKGMICGECNVIAMGASSITCTRETCPGKAPKNLDNPLQ